MDSPCIIFTHSFILASTSLLINLPKKGFKPLASQNTSPLARLESMNTSLVCLFTKKRLPVTPPGFSSNVCSGTLFFKFMMTIALPSLTTLIYLPSGWKDGEVSVPPILSKISTLSHVFVSKIVRRLSAVTTAIWEASAEKTNSVTSAGIGREVRSSFVWKFQISIFLPVPAAIK